MIVRVGAASAAIVRLFNHLRAAIAAEEGVLEVELLELDGSWDDLVGAALAAIGGISKSLKSRLKPLPVCPAWAWC